MRFNNDYNKGAHPAIIKALADHNDTSFPGYGTDDLCAMAADSIRKYLDGSKEYDIHFLEGGTQANYTVIASALRPYQAVISADTGHISCHETGAVENTGHKIIALNNSDGKISAEDIEKTAKDYADSRIKEHIVMPRMVYISFPTELGSLYSLKELEDIKSVCTKYSMYLFIDGARMGYGLGSSDNDVSLKDISRLADVFYIGGTKCGALFGEAVVIGNDELKPDFRSYIKQNGGMLAKGWLLGLQFQVLFEDGLYFQITKKAVDEAYRIRNAFMEKGIPLKTISPTNQQFALLTKEQAEHLEKEYVFEFEGMEGDMIVARFCTSFATVKEETDALIRTINEL